MTVSAIDDNGTNGTSCVMATYKTYLRQRSAASWKELCNRSSFFTAQHSTAAASDPDRPNLLLLAARALHVAASALL